MRIKFQYTDIQAKHYLLYIDQLFLHDHTSASLVLLSMLQSGQGIQYPLPRVTLYPLLLKTSTLQIIPI